MIVCVCRRVSDRDIERRVRNGCETFEELQIDTGVASCCGRCTECAQSVFESVQTKARPELGSKYAIPIKPIPMAA